MSEKKGIAVVKKVENTVAMWNPAVTENTILNNGSHQSGHM